MLVIIKEGPRSRWRRFRRWLKRIVYGLLKIPLPHDEWVERGIQYSHFIDLEAGTHVKKKEQL